ncbi:MAG: hypothetical protein IRD7MM_03645 [Candidatus Midichloria mitochondrii]
MTLNPFFRPNISVCSLLPYRTRILVSCAYTKSSIPSPFRSALPFAIIYGDFGRNMFAFTASIVWLSSTAGSSVIVMEGVKGKKSEQEKIDIPLVNKVL